MSGEFDQGKKQDVKTSELSFGERRKLRDASLAQAIRADSPVNRTINLKRTVFDLLQMGRLQDAAVKDVATMHALALRGGTMSRSLTERLTDPEYQLAVGDVSFVVELANISVEAKLDELRAALKDRNAALQKGRERIALNRQRENSRPSTKGDLRPGEQLSLQEVAAAPIEPGAIALSGSQEASIPTEMERAIIEIENVDGSFESRLVKIIELIDDQWGDYETMSGAELGAIGISNQDVIDARNLGYLPKINSSKRTKPTLTRDQVASVLCMKRHDKMVFSGLARPLQDRLRKSVSGKARTIREAQKRDTD